MIEENVKKPEENPVPKPAEPQPQAAAAPAQKEAKSDKVATPKKERPANCAACNKSIKKKRWYYRNGKFYCTKRCWGSTLKKDAPNQPAKEPEAKDAAK